DGAQRRLVIGDARRGRRTNAKRGADELKVFDAIGARPAPPHMALHQDLLVHGQLVVKEPLEPLAGVLAANVGSHACSPSSSARSACRARVSRDFTVPTATPSEKAISS